jgi:broad specificity phosphatase PhoE
MLAVRRLLMVRHGQSAWNAEGRWQGWIDVALTPLGEAQAEARGLALAADRLGDAVVYTSDLQRARRTAELIAAALDAPVVTEPRLRERFGGEWQGHTAAEIDEGWPGLREQYRRREISAPPGAERDETVLARVDAALLDVVTAEPARRTIVLVTHGGVLRMVADRAGVTADNVVENVGGHWFEWRDGRLVAGAPLPRLETGGAAALE